jgi:hypothetical protein
MKKSAINAVVVDDEYIDFEAHVAEAAIPPGAFPQLDNGIWKYFLIREKDGSYRSPLLPETNQDTVDPSELYDAVLDECTPRFFGKKENPAKKWSIVALWVISGVLILILFFMWASHLGK